MIDDAAIVIPAYNEEASLGSTLRELKPHAADIIVVDDGSRDRTMLEARGQGVTCLRLATNQGYGAAVQAGVRWAVERSSAPFIVTFDADGQHDPNYLQALLEPLRSATSDYVIGSRILARDLSSITGARLFGSRVISCVTTALTGARITDPTSGLLAFPRTVARIILSPYYPHDYPDADFIIMLARMGFRISEVPVRIRPSPPGKQSMHAGLLRPLYYTAKMTLSMLNLATRRDLRRVREEIENVT